MEHPAVSVIVATRDRAERLSTALRSFLEQAGAAAEVVVADDGSTDDTPARVALLAAAYPGRVRYVAGPFGGPGPARNAAAAAATGELIVVADDDTEAPADWLARLLEARGREGAEVLCYALSPATLDAAPAAYLHYRNALVTGTRFRRDYIGPAFFLMRRDLFLEVGGFSTERLRAAEDFEFCHRLQGRGIGVVFDPSITVAHHYAQDWDSVSRRIVATARDGALVYRQLDRSRGLLTLRACLKLAGAPLWLLRVFPAGLYLRALRLEGLFFRERLKALWLGPGE